MADRILKPRAYCIVCGRRRNRSLMMKTGYGYVCRSTGKYHSCLLQPGNYYHEQVLRLMRVKKFFADMSKLGVRPVNQGRLNL